MYFSRNDDRIWNSLSNELRKIPKTKFKRKIHHRSLQKLSDVNEYIVLLKTELRISDFQHFH